VSLLSPRSGSLLNSGSGYATGIVPSGSINPVIAHGLGTADIVVAVHEVATGMMPDVTVEALSTSSIRLTFSTAPTVGQYRYIILSAAAVTGGVSLTKADIGLGSVDNTSDVAKPISTLVTSALASKAPGIYCVPTGGDDTTALQAVLDANTAVTGRTVRLSGTYTTSATIYIKGHLDASDAIINYSGASIAVQVGAGGAGVRIDRAHIDLPQVVCTTKPSTGWIAGTVGIKIVNAQSCIIDVLHIIGFETGLLVYGQGGGVVYDTITLGHLDNNKRNLVTDSDATGWSNQNTYLGGRFSHSSSEGLSVAGTRHILLSTSPSLPNNNLFLNCSVESAGIIEQMVECYGVYNVFLSCRWENGAYPVVVHWGPAAQYNQILYGYNAQIITEVIDTGAAHNTIIHAKGGRHVAQGSFSHVFENDTSSASPVISVMDAGAAAAGTNVFTNWRHRIQATDYSFKNAGDAYPRVMIETATGRVYLGNGLVTPAVWLYATASTALINGPLSFIADNTYDLGGANLRPKKIFAGTAFVFPSYTTGTRPLPATAGAGGTVWDTTLSALVTSDGAAWVKSRGATTVNIMDAPYNAVGDGVADDTAAFLAAIAGVPTGTELFIPVGTFKITSNLSWASSRRISLKGSGHNSVLALTGCGVIITGSASFNRFVLRDLALVRTGTVGIALSIDGSTTLGVSRFRTDNLYISSAGGTGIHIEGAWVSTWISPVVTACALGWDISRDVESAVTSSNSHIVVGGETQGCVLGWQVKACAAIALSMHATEGNTFGIQTSDTERHFTINHCYFEANTNGDIDFGGTATGYGCAVKNSIFFGSGTAAQAIRLLRGKNFTIEQNSFVNYTTQAVLVQDDSGTTTTGRVRNNYLTGTPKEMTSTSVAFDVPLPDIQVFTANGTWNKPPNATRVQALGIGAGGGGGAGARLASGTASSGGAGGAGGAYSSQSFRAIDLSTTETVTVTAGGTGAVAQTADGANGAAGGTGSAGTVFGSSPIRMKVFGGGGGGGGSTALSAGGAISGAMTNGIAGGGCPLGAAGTASSGASFAPCGGGGGGGISAGVTPGTGAGSGGVNNIGVLASGTTAINANGANGASGTLNSATGGQGGSGGGASATGVGGNGGTGGSYGAGGGGGGASLNGFNSGAGGNGGGGILIVISD
jgi:hypothetical protein